MEELENDIILAETASDIIRIHGDGRMTGEYVRIILCTEGGVTVGIDGKKVPLRDGDLLICIPGVSLAMKPEGGKAQMLAVRYRRFLQAIRTVPDVWAILMYTRTNPVFPLSPSEKYLTRSYYEVIKGKTATPKDVYYDDILLSLMQCAILEICVILSRSIGDGLRNSRLSQKELLFKRFLELISEKKGKERKAGVYADELCVTPKYLTAVCVDICGVPAHEMILQHATHQIKLALDYPSKSIKEISVEYGFPDLSSFGKFVRTRLGASPKALRANR